MEELIQQALELARGMWSRRWIGVAVAWVVALAGGALLTLVADSYEASARVYVDTKTVLRPLLHDLTVEPDMDQTINLLARTLITRPNAELLMKRSKLETPGMSPVARDRVVERLLRDIKVAASGRDNVFTFSFRDTGPEQARQVVQNLVSLFLESDTGSKRRDAESAREFIDEQIKNYEARLTEAENRLKDFKLRNMGTTDTSGKDYFARIAALTEEMNKTGVELRAAEQSRDALKRELSGETESLMPDMPPPVATSELDTRLDAQRKQLDDLLRRYTELHPDVIQTKRLIARLEEQRQQELEARRRAAANAPVTRGSSAVNPVMQRVKLAMAEAEANVAALRVRSGDLQSRVAQLRASANRLPQVEAELAQLNRDYDIIRRTYEAMVARREKASLSEDVDATRSAQFRVIDPPRTAPQPVFPNRLALAPAILLLALLAGVGATALACRMLPTFDNVRALRQATRRAVLGSVSMVLGEVVQQRARRQHVAFGSALGGLFVVAGTWITWVALHARV